MAYDGTTGLLNSITDAANETSTLDWTASRRFAKYTRADATDWTVEPAQTKGYATLVKTSDVAAVYTDAEQNTWTRQTDRYGYVTAETTALSDTTQVTRDGFGLRTGTDDDGARIGRMPDWLGREVKRENADGTYDFWTYNATSRPGQPATHTDAKGRTTEYTWSNDRLMSVENHLGHVTSYTYTTEGLLESVTRPVDRDHQPRSHHPRIHMEHGG